ncbi:MAG: hypothetical protein PHR49_08275 [Methanoculleus sp.]|jgi:ABC-type multidrug transport system permease subunit|uniref:hypothetical protein n=1 Tax=unclassified Methanoculleus TaxID=2619537 RepID=UPI0025FA1264|nr:hypothetical protein [Methanoculleus sp. UBA377]MDD2473969.1 hypothetical protein [Methanoculleus sp.]
MDIEKTVKKTKVVIFAALIVGVVLLAVGILFGSMDGNQALPDGKAIIGLSFIPLSAALASYIKLSMIRRSPQKMKEIIISDNDERLVALKNEAEANAFRILQAVLFLTYMGYTFMVPEDIFESVGWWIVTVLLFVSLILQAVLLTASQSGPQTTDVA